MLGKTRKAAAKILASLAVVLSSVAVSAAQQVTGTLCSSEGVSRFALVVAVAGFLGASGSAVAENAIKAPAQKSIGTAKQEIVPSLIVMNSDSASLTGTTLTLNGISLNSIMFADRPVRSAGHALTKHLLEEWAPGGGFEKDPPNATVSVFDKEASDVEDAVLVLKDPKLSGDKLTFTVDVLESNIAKADGPASVFIDIIGLPRTPLSFAGVARRTAFRGAWYAGAATGAAYAVRADPYYRPPYPPPACGYYPYPPCY
ncbi:hypothetical protein SAZ10_14015 [Mesorhizobium sp. BAC0120]|uniref:hypothetical protein n=1 Tax=Mesorhizobium sp. BAC0120 TaxID=3090670 RepID=UPI00298C15D3|nr:hypothetical protein [Mesorhizobium sp. BAC0120]MDW6022876.1 hypothetical protein [Mesorhizobium sp. BAC0120]